MRTLKFYECEICNARFTEERFALNCESRGVPTAYPKGMVFNNAADQSAFYKDITFAVYQCEVHGHCLGSSLWACRNNGVGDSLGEDLCGNSNELRLGEKDAPDPSNLHPTFIRLVEWLIKNKVYVTVWDGQKPIPLGTFLLKSEKKEKI